MKRFYIFLVFILTTLHSVAQLNFSAKETTVFLEPGVEKFGYIYVGNRTGGDIEYEWEFHSNSFNDNWAIQFCECTSCYTNEFDNFITAADSGQYCGTIADQGEIEWKIGIHPDGEAISVEEFSVIVKNLTAGTQDTLRWMTDISLSVELENKNNVSYSVFPNPANENLTVSVANLNVQTATVLVRDILGATVHSSSFQGQNTVQLSTTNLNKGVYFVEVYNDDQSLFVERLVIAH